MAQKKQKNGLPFDLEHWERIQRYEKTTNWILRITEYKEKPVPVLVVKERIYPAKQPDQTSKPTSIPRKTRDRGWIYGQHLRLCLPVIRRIISRVCDDAGIPLELHRVFPNGQITFRGNLPLDYESGPKLSLIFKLAERVSDPSRVELIAMRVAHFTAEEANYWLTRCTQYGEAANRWTLAGMRIMLGGQPGDRAIQTMIDKLKNSL